jgi:hypothetical protein
MSFPSAATLKSREPSRNVRGQPGPPARFLSRRDLKSQRNRSRGFRDKTETWAAAPVRGGAESKRAVSAVRTTRYGWAEERSVTVRAGARKLEPARDPIRAGSAALEDVDARIVAKAIDDDADRRRAPVAALRVLVRLGSRLKQRLTARQTELARARLLQQSEPPAPRVDKLDHAISFALLLDYSRCDPVRQVMDDQAAGQHQVATAKRKALGLPGYGDPDRCRPCGARPLGRTTSGLGLDRYRHRPQLAELWAARPESRPRIPHRKLA